MDEEINKLGNYNKTVKKAVFVQIVSASSTVQRNSCFRKKCFSKGCKPVNKISKWPEISIFYSGFSEVYSCLFYLFVLVKDTLSLHQWIASDSPFLQIKGSCCSHEVSSHHPLWIICTHAPVWSGSPGAQLSYVIGSLSIQWSLESDDSLSIPNHILIFPGWPINFSTKFIILSFSSSLVIDIRCAELISQNRSA